MFASGSPSDLAARVDNALLLLVIVCLILLVGITATMVYFVIRYRRSRVQRTKQIRGNLRLEILWTVIPTLIAVGLFFVGYEDFVAIRNVPPDALDVRVTGQQWFWSFYYPDTDVTSQELYVPVGRPVKFTLSAPASDVIHSFYLPAFRVKEDVVPGSETTMWIEAKELGTYNIFCAEFCGAGHSSMLSKMHVVSQADYDAWVQKRIDERYEPVDAALAMNPDAEALQGYDGAALFKQYCVACHGKEGHGGGPYNARNLTSLDGWKSGTKLTDIVTTISRGLPGTQMRPFGHLPIRERLALMHYVASLNQSGVRPTPTEEDIANLKRELPETDPTKAVQAPAVKPSIPIDHAMDQVVQDGVEP
jgi:cytochrome c oxidase subunit 2